MALDIRGNIFNQRDVRESPETVANKTTVDSTQNFNDTTTLNSFVDVSGGSVTISGLLASKTYSLFVLSSLQLTYNRSDQAHARLVIAGNNRQELQTNFASGSITKQCIPIVDVLTGQTGATSYLAKVQFKKLTAAGASLTIDGAISIIAIEE